MSDNNDPDIPDEIDINLRSKDEVITRIRILTAVILRAFSELNPESSSSEDTGGLAGERFDLLSWLADDDVTHNATAWEQFVLNRPAGGLSSEDANIATWGIEALTSLATAVGIWHMENWAPRPIDPQLLLALLPSPIGGGDAERPPMDFLQESEIASMRETAELWYWRVGVEEERRATPKHSRSEITQLIAEVATEATEAGRLEHMVESDFSFEGRPFRSIETWQLERAFPIAEQRLLALNWLCGFGRSWDQVPLDV